jgi:hypothetical protein
LKVPLEVLRELGEADGIGAWIRQIRPSMTVAPVKSVTKIAVELRTLYPALTEGKMGHASADPWIIASGEHHNWVVVSEEKSGMPNKLKMPDVCLIRGVDHVAVLGFLRALETKICRTCLERRSG